MLRFVLVVLLAVSEGVGSLENSGYLSYLRNSGKHRSLQELRLRLSLFRASQEMVRESNEQNLPFKLTLNKFSDMTNEELAQYRGLNVSAVEPDNAPPLATSLGDEEPPPTVDWISKGFVTPAKDQGRCGSCWAFGSTVALEGAYKEATGTLKNFAEQEYLDCVFTTRDGCTGGAVHACFQYNQRTGHMASQANYPYTATDMSREECDLSGYKNSLISARVSGRITVRHKETEENTIRNLSWRPVTLVIEATRTLYAYSEGILMDRTCWAQTNHAVAGVGYTPRYIIVKNSWGADWGESGFFKVLRGWRNCGLYTTLQYPLMQMTEEPETEDASIASQYDHSAIIGPEPPKPDSNCENMFGDAYCNRLALSSCHARQTREVTCRKKCGNCWIE